MSAITQPAPLHQRVLQRLQQTLGEARASTNRIGHWAVSPGSDRHDVHILLEDRGHPHEPAALWIFNPNIPNDGVSRCIIENDEQLDLVIQSIQAQSG